MRPFKGRLGVIAIILISVMPVFIWLSLKPLSLRLESAYMVWTSIGQVTGLIGITLFSLGIILSARLSFLEEYFGGLDRMYNVHHIIGTLGFLFLLIHPLTLAARYLPLSLYDTAQFFLIDMDDWPRSLGIISLILFMALLFVTFFAKWRYQIRRFLHQTLGIAFFLGAIHGLFIPSDISNSVAMQWSILPLICFALIAFGYRTLLGRATVGRYTYSVSAVNRLDETVTEVIMFPTDGHLLYKPGQFLFLSFKGGGIISEVHPFSISSAPSEPVLRVTAKALGDYTKSLPELRVGATALVEGPFGAFSYLTGRNLNQIWIAGGIGITPFLNMARHLRVHHETGHTIDFYYSTRTKQEMIFLEELNQISLAYPNFRVIPFNADEHGFISMDAIQKVSQEIMGKDIYVCGPPPMMNSIIAQCRAKGIPSKLVHSEQFKLL